MLYIHIIVFFLLQVGSGLLYKWGSLHRDSWWAGFILGNLLGISSIYFLMEVYKRLNPNVSEAVCRGGYFVLIQIAFIVCYHSRLNLLQWGGMAMIVGGIALVSIYQN